MRIIVDVYIALCLVLADTLEFDLLKNLLIISIDYLFVGGIDSIDMAWA